MILIPLIIVTVLVSILIIREETEWHYNRTRTQRLHKKTRKKERLTNDGWK